MPTKLLPFSLKCADGGDAPPIPGHVGIDGDRLSIWLDGSCPERGFEALAVEQVDGKPRVIIWREYAADEPTHKIPLHLDREAL